MAETALWEDVVLRAPGLEVYVRSAANPAAYEVEQGHMAAFANRCRRGVFVTGNLIFIGGVHGVGKTTFCDVLLKKYQIPSYSASRLISKRKAVQFNANKKTGNIPGNQSLLVDAIREFELGQELFLLDGHFCLVRDDGGVARIPETTFVQLMPAGIVVLTDSAANIAQRVEGRDGVSWTRAFVD